MIDDYKDIIDLPYPRNDWNFLMKHPRMSVANRAKIFSPFAALRGHNEKIAETAEQHLDATRDENMWEDVDGVLSSNIMPCALRFAGRVREWSRPPACPSP